MSITSAQYEHLINAIARYVRRLRDGAGSSRTVPSPIGTSVPQDAEAVTND